MALSAQDIQLIESRAELISERVSEKVISKVLAAHITSCAHGRFLFAGRRLVVGIMIGIALVSAGSSAATALLIKFL